MSLESQLQTPQIYRWEGSDWIPLKGSNGLPVLDSYTGDYVVPNTYLSGKEPCIQDPIKVFLICALGEPVAPYLWGTTESSL